MILGDPHAIESLQLRDGGATDPARVLAIDRNHHRHLGVLRVERVLDALVQTLTEIFHHGGASSNDDRTVELLAQVNVAGLDAVDDELVHAWVLEADHRGAEKNLGCFDSV